MKVYDLVIIGAGIHGVGVAQAAAARGLSVAIVERRPEAGLETSSASSKLIHGGLRYLETGQFHLVYECLKERKLLLRNASPLVKMKTFYLPVYGYSKRHPFWIGLGLFLYWALSGGRSRMGFLPLKKSAWAGLGICQKNLRAVFAYEDAQTNDRLLTQAVLRSAEHLGCDTYLGKSIVRIEEGDLYQIALTDGVQISSRSLVNAAGPWVNDVAKQIPNAETCPLDWVQGTHIVLDIPAKEACFYCESPSDGRAVFVLPWQEKTLVGTTELIRTQPHAEVTEPEVEYLLKVFNHYFPSQPCLRENVIQSFAGVRVLPVTNKGAVVNANKHSRETVFICNSGSHKKYVGIYGGKLTSYRATAQKVLALLLPYLNSHGVAINSKSDPTQTIKIDG